MSADLQGFEQQVSARIEELLSLPIIASILRELDAGLPAELCYHSPSHTRDVLAEAVRFGMLDGLPPRSVELLAIAAAYHDSGFLVTPHDNEPIGADRAVHAMDAAGGYDRGETALVKSMILDTKLVPLAGGAGQQPSTELAKYLLDADLANFGRDDFFEKVSLLAKELGQQTEVMLAQTRKLIAHHSYFTHAATLLRNAKKQENVLRLAEMTPA